MFTMRWLAVVLVCLNVGATVGQCPAYWTLFGERCINITSKVGSWAEGMKYCKSMGGQLINIDTADLQTFLSPIVSTTAQAKNITLHTRNEYKYHYLHDLGVDVTKTSSVTFAVKACNDAHIALSKTKGLDSSDTYEIVIGGWSDSESVIRDCKQCAHMDEVHHKSHPLSCSQPHPFWVSWDNNYIRVGKGNTVGEQQFMVWNDTDPHPVNYVAVSTGFGSTGDWTFFRDTYMPGKFWVGATDLVTENEWIWLPAQSPISEYTNWLPGQPDNANGNQHCLVLDANSGMKWRDDNCEDDRNFICEKQIDDTSGIIG
ncbi:uncharacterized protein LOC123547911 [Mercenaria mercenaria]|uniref:uncharacterized protein LOC123547911 n=1 Tax=Mercenaria mercenaria TaxID=6596 RepID=UPI001E1D3EFD|nr:uncharacterized protein LOC123547911 [Mercenaria mercenaria]